MIGEVQKDSERIREDQGGSNSSVRLGRVQGRSGGSGRFRVVQEGSGGFREVLNCSKMYILYTRSVLYIF